MCLVTQLCPTLSAPWAVARQAPLSMGFPSQEYWSGLPFPPPGDLPDPGIKPTSPPLAEGFFTTEPPGIVTQNIGFPPTPHPPSILMSKRHICSYART